MNTDTTAELDIGEPDKEISVKKTFGIDSDIFSETKLLFGTYPDWGMGFSSDLRYFKGNHISHSQIETESYSNYNKISENQD